MVTGEEKISAKAEISYIVRSNDQAAAKLYFRILEKQVKEWLSKSLV